MVTVVLLSFLPYNQEIRYFPERISIEIDW